MARYHNCLCKYRQIFHSNNLCPLLLVNRRQQLSLQPTSTTANRSTKNATTDSTSSSKFVQEWAEAKPFEEIPTMSTFQLLRNYLPGGKYTNLDAKQLLMAMKNDVGTISKLNGYFGRPDCVITHNPDDFPIVLRNEGVWPIKPGLAGARHHRSIHRADFFQGVGGLFASQGEQWGAFRSVINPVVLQPKNAGIYLNKMSQVNTELIERIIEIRDPHTFEVPATFLEELNRWGLESVCVVALDKQLGLIKSDRDNPEAVKLLGYLTDIFTYSVDVAFRPPILKIIKTNSFKMLMKALDGVTDTTNKYISEVFQRLEEDQRTGVPEKPESEKSVLEKLIKIDKKIATILAMDMIIAGVDTTSSAFASLLLCLAKNPDKQAILREEVLKALPSKDSVFQEVTFKNMPYLRACLKEALRIYPLVVGTTRRPVNDVVLSGYRVPKGTQVSIITTSLLANDAYYPRANEFLPERWIRSSKGSSLKPTTKECPEAMKSSNPFIYIPFSFGPRSCVGRRIAEMEMELGAALLVRNFHIEFNYPTENAFKSFLISVPNIPLRFKFTDVEH